MNNIEEIAEQSMTEFIGPNFNLNGYCNAKYRMSSARSKIRGVEVPTRIEALRENGDWKQHPVVFVHYGSYEARKNDEGLLVIIRSDKKWISVPYRFLERMLYREAETRGLTEGDLLFVKPIAKEED